MIIEMPTERIDVAEFRNDIDYNNELERRVTNLQFPTTAQNNNVILRTEDLEVGTTNIKEGLNFDNLP